MAITITVHKTAVVSKQASSLVLMRENGITFV